MASKLVTPVKDRNPGERPEGPHVDTRSNLAARRASYAESLKGGTGSNGMTYHRPGSNKR